MYNTAGIGLRVRIEKLVYGGAGLARTDGGVVFVGRVLPGELVDVEVVDRKKDYARARLEAVVEPCEDRREPLCPNFATAGCCGWSHIAYARQIALKESIVREALRRHGRIEWESGLEPVTAPEREYRIRARFHVVDGDSGPRLGFLEEGTRNVVPIAGCAALAPQLNRFIAEANASLAERPLRGADEVSAIVSPDTGHVGASFHRGRERVSWKRREPRTRVRGIEYRLRADAFFQPNRFLLEPMMAEVADAVAGAKTVLDLFCGSAFFSLPMARAGAAVVGVDRRSVANASWNARHNEIRGVEFVKAPAWAYLRTTRAAPDALILDPPRTGAGKNVVRRVASIAPPRVAYVSCNPTTFAPEARILIDNGYRLASLRFVDQFPGTPHIETVALFER